MTREQPILANQRIQDSAQWGLGREQGCQGILHIGAWTTTVHCCATTRKHELLRQVAKVPDRNLGPAS